MVFNEKRKAPRKQVHIPVLCWETDGEKRIGKGVDQSNAVNRRQTHSYRIAPGIGR